MNFRGPGFELRWPPTQKLHPTILKNSRQFHPTIQLPKNSDQLVGISIQPSNCQKIRTSWQEIPSNHPTCNIFSIQPSNHPTSFTTLAQTPSGTLFGPDFSNFLGFLDFCSKSENIFTLNVFGEELLSLLRFAPLPCTVLHRRFLKLIPSQRKIEGKKSKSSKHRRKST